MNDAMNLDTLIDTLAHEVRIAGAKTGDTECAAAMEVLRDAREEKAALTFDEALTRFVAICQEISDAHMARFENLAKPRITTVRGVRYVKLVREGSVHCFVDIKTGDVLKAATWRAPAKHARGNVFSADGGRGAMGPYGAHYLA